MPDFLKFFCIQFILYGLLTWNYRMVAQARLISIGVSDFIIASLQFWLIKQVSSVDTTTAWVGYAMGGALGSILSAWLTKKIYGE